MKTRVIKRFDTRNAIWIFWVQKWALWDPPDLRRSFPYDYDWRFVRPYPTQEEAEKTAARLSAHEGLDPLAARSIDGYDEFEIVKEYGQT